MWLLEWDGLGVENVEFKVYLEKNGKYFNLEDYLIIINEDLNKKINKVWWDGVYYLNGNKYDGLIGGILFILVYVEVGKGFIDKSGLVDVVLGFGLSMVVIRGSVIFGKKNKLKGYDYLDDLLGDLNNKVKIKKYDFVESVNKYWY